MFPSRFSLMLSHNVKASISMFSSYIPAEELKPRSEYSHLKTGIEAILLQLKHQAIKVGL